MTVMATTTPARASVTGAEPAGKPRLRAARTSRRLRLSAACYAGIVLMIALTLVAARVLPTAAGVALFAAGMAAVVAVAHPAIRVTHRIR
jgi:hypothetical protein